VDYGCDFCADDRNRLFGPSRRSRLIGTEAAFSCDVLAATPSMRTPPGGFDETQRLTVAEARRAFRNWSLPSDIREH
jgi:hypothetical protein